jgi:hypothetical protein
MTFSVRLKLGPEPGPTGDGGTAKVRGVAIALERLGPTRSQLSLTAAKPAEIVFSAKLLKSALPGEAVETRAVGKLLGSLSLVDEASDLEFSVDRFEPDPGLSAAPEPDPSASALELPRALRLELSEQFRAAGAEPIDDHGTGRRQLRAGTERPSRTGRALAEQRLPHGIRRNLQLRHESRQGRVPAVRAREPAGHRPEDRRQQRGGLPLNAQDATALRARIAGAQQLQATLGSRFHPNTVVLFGDDLRTDTNFNWNAGVVDKVDGIEDLKLKINQGGIDPNPDSPGKLLQGDGTVPAVSARVPSAPAGTPRVGVSGAEHAVCFAKQEFMNQVEFFARKLLGF